MFRAMLAVSACVFLATCSEQEAPPAAATATPGEDAAISEMLKKAAEGPALTTAADSIAPPLMHWKQWGRINKYILVKPDVSEAEMVELARKLHRAEPTTGFYFVDDDSRIAELKALLDQKPDNVEEVLAGEKAQELQAWQSQHTKGHVTSVIQTKDGKMFHQWILLRGTSLDPATDTIAVLEEP